MSLKPNKRKTINVKYPLWHEITIEAAKLDTDAYEITLRAWDLYKREKLRKPSTPIKPDEELKDKLLRLWYEPEGAEKAVRALLSRLIDYPEPQ